MKNKNILILTFVATVFASCNNESPLAFQDEKKIYDVVNILPTQHDHEQCLSIQSVSEILIKEIYSPIAKEAIEGYQVKLKSIIQKINSSDYTDEEATRDAKKYRDEISNYLTIHLNYRLAELPCMKNFYELKLSPKATKYLGKFENQIYRQKGIEALWVPVCKAFEKKGHKFNQNPFKNY